VRGFHRIAQQGSDAASGFAKARLRDHGLDGLNVVDVAADCGRSHATVIHHFGNTAGMRRAAAGTGVGATGNAQ